MCYRWCWSCDEHVVHIHIVTSVVGLGAADRVDSHTAIVRVRVCVSERI